MVDRLKRFLLAPVRWGLGLAGRVYVPGGELDDALSVSSQLTLDGRRRVTLGYFHSDDDTPADVASAVSQALTAVSAQFPGSYVSIKVPALAYRRDLLEPLVRACMEHGVLVHFDSHEIHKAEQTLQCVRDAVAWGARVGLSVPGRWQRSMVDAVEMARLGVRVRLVKGEWADPADPRRDLRAGFLQIAERLANASDVPVALASHDLPLVKEAAGMLRAASRPCELELLNGLPSRELVQWADEQGLPVTYYVPYGISWRPYAVGKALRHPHIIWWVFKDALRGAWRIVMKPQ